MSNTTYTSKTTLTPVGAMRPRAKSLHHDSLAVISSGACVRCASCRYDNGTTATTSTLHHGKRLRISYIDDTLCINSRANMYRLLRAAQDTTAPRDNSGLIAQKALRFRKLLASARDVDVDDPAFDIATFMRVTWCKTER